jgi:hypothetical protein
MSNELTTTITQDDIGLQNDDYELLACINLDSNRFCDFYGVNIDTFIDLAFSESEH